MTGSIPVPIDCDSEGVISTNTMTGCWHGSIETDSVTYRFSFVCEQREETICRDLGGAATENL